MTQSYIGWTLFPEAAEPQETPKLPPRNFQSRRVKQRPRRLRDVNNRLREQSNNHADESSLGHHKSSANSFSGEQYDSNFPNIRSISDYDSESACSSRVVTPKHSQMLQGGREVSNFLVRSKWIKLMHKIVHDRQMQEMQWKRHGMFTTLVVSVFAPFLLLKYFIYLFLAENISFY